MSGASELDPQGLEAVGCPLCGSEESAPWASEHGFAVVRCVQCALLFVNPRPSRERIAEAVARGMHAHAGERVNVVSRRIGRKVSRYRRLLSRLFSDVWSAGRPIRWVDVGAGYGEVVEAVTRLAPVGSIIEGVEPMEAKARHAQARNLPVTQGWLDANRPPADIVSLVDVFSHIPDFSEFLKLIRQIVRPGGELFLETGNLAELDRREEFSNELGLPDHLVFAGEGQIRSFLATAGFDVVTVERYRFDGVINVAKSVVKRMLGREIPIRLPYRSNYRQLLIRARRNS